MKEGITTKYQVFVSSTYEDLIEERKVVSQAILESGCIPAGMELFPATDKTQWEFIKSVIDECDIYLVILAGRYGSLGKDDLGNEVGYTEMEFDYAQKKGKYIIALTHSDLQSIAQSKSEVSATRTRMLKKFYEKAKTGRVIAKWNNKDNLKSAVLNALKEAVKSNKRKGLGWVRVKGTVDKLIKENKRLAEELKTIQVNNARIQDENETMLMDMSKLKMINETQETKIKELTAIIENEKKKVEVANREILELKLLIYNANANPSVLKDNSAVDDIIVEVQGTLAIGANDGDKMFE